MGIKGLASVFRIAQSIQGDVEDAGLSILRRVTKLQIETELDRYDRFITHDSLRSSTRTLFAGSHFARSVEEALKCLNNAVKEKSRLKDLDGDALMRTAFSPANPVLRLNQLKTKSEKDEQRGYMDLYAGVMGGVRNPRAHEHLLQDTSEDALELLGIANHLMRKLEKSTRVRRQRTRQNNQTRPTALYSFDMDD